MAKCCRVIQGIHATMGGIRITEDDSNQTPFLFDGTTPDQLPPTARVLTVDLNGEAVAYPYDLLSELNVINDTVGENDVVVFWTEGTASALDTSDTPKGAKSARRHTPERWTARRLILNSKMEQFSTSKQAVNGIFLVFQLWESSKENNSTPLFPAIISGSHGRRSNLRRESANCDV